MRLAVHGGRDAGGNPVALGFQEGRIADFNPAGDGIDLGGRLLLPGLVDGHVHLDKTVMGLGWVPYSGGAGVATRVANERRLRQSLAWDVGRQGDALLARMSACGTTALRTHVDVDDLVRLDNLHAVLALRERWAGRMTIQVVAFPQSGILRCPGVAELLDEALRQGADVMGGLDPAGFDGDVEGALDVVFGLAERHDKPVDIHLHDGGETGLAELRAIAARTAALGMQGRVMVSHAFALGDAGEAAFGAVAAALAASGVAILTSIPGDRPFPPLARLAAAGVTVCLGSDNIRDTWSPMTVVSMLERAMLAAYRSGMRGDEQLAACLALATEGGAKALGLAAPGLHLGAPADLIAVEAPCPAAAVVDRMLPDLVVRGGEIVIDRISTLRGEC